jgi:hypothetical protein
MRFGTHQFPGDAGRHVSPQGEDCLGRIFEAKQVGVGGAYVNRVECAVCHRVMPASEDRLLPDSPMTSLYEAAIL